MKPCSRLIDASCGKIVARYRSFLSTDHIDEEQSTNHNNDEG